MVFVLNLVLVEIILDALDGLAARVGPTSRVSGMVAGLGKLFCSSVGDVAMTSVRAEPESLFDSVVPCLLAETWSCRKALKRAATSR